MSPINTYLLLLAYLCFEAIFGIPLSKYVGSLGWFFGKLAAVALSLLVFSRLYKLNLKMTLKPLTSKSFFLPAIIVSLPVIIFTWSLSSFVHQIYPPSFSQMERSGWKWKQGLLPEGLSQWQWLWDIFYLAVATSTIEELIFRGVILVCLTKTRGWLSGLVTTSCLFALLHTNPWHMPDLILSGLYFGFLQLQFGSFWPAAMAHGMTNLFSVIYHHWEFLAPLKDPRLLPWILIGSGILGIFGLRFLIKETRDFSWLKKLKWPGPEKYQIFEVLLVLLCLFFTARIFTESGPVQSIVPFP